MKGKFDPETVRSKCQRNVFIKEHGQLTGDPENSTSHITIHELPPELLIEIFSWFSVRDLCLTISPVCKFWYLSSQYPCLWKNLSFNGQSVTTERLCSLLSHATQLQILQIVDRVDAAAVLEQVALTNRQLQVLIVKRCVGSPLQIQIHEDVLLKLIKNCSKLFEITIKETQFYSETIFNVMAINLPDLKRINFDYNEHFGSRSVNIIASNFQHLEEVCLFWPWYGNSPANPKEDCIDDNAVIELCTRMKNSLEVLTIFARELTNDAMNSIVQCTCLYTLNLLEASRLTDDGILMLTTLHKLYSLEFSWAWNISLRGWLELFIRSNWNSLTVLSLVDCFHVNDDVLECIAGNCPNLQNIRFYICTPIREKCMSALIRGCQQLMCLRVECSGLNVVQSFPLIPTFTPNLRRLVCTCICFHVGLPTQKLIFLRWVLLDLRNQLPNLKIHARILP